MTKQVKFIASKQTSYANALHTSFHIAQYNRITALPAPDLKAWRIEPLLAAWDTSIKMEMEINREAAASIDTQTLKKLDIQRGRLTNLIFGLVKVESSYGVVASRQEAATRLSIITKTYGRLDKEAYREQTVHTGGLLTDLKKPQSFADLKTLGLSAYVSQLQTANDEFQKIMDQRSVTKAQTRLPPSRVQRKVTDEAYNMIVERIKAAFAFSDTDAERERINLLITLMNKVSDEHKARHHQATGQTASTTNRDGKIILPPNPNTPPREEPADGE